MLSIFNTLACFNITVANLIISLITCLGSVGLLYWGIQEYKAKCLQDRFGRLRKQLLELKYCFQQINNSMQNDSIAVLSKELVTEIFKVYDKDILDALLKANPSDKRTSRLEPIIYSVLRKNKDVRYLSKMSNRVQLLLAEIKYSLPIYSSLLYYLFFFLISHKQKKADIAHLLFLFIDNSILNQLIQELSRDKVDRLTKELFAFVLYQALTKDKTKNSRSLEVSNSNPEGLIQEILTKLLDAYIIFNNNSLLDISNKQIKNYIPEKYTKDALVGLWNNISDSFSPEEQQYIFSKLSILLDKVDFIDNRIQDNTFPRGN